MSPKRRSIYDLHLERLELFALQAAEARRGVPFAMLVMDLADAAGFKIAAALAGEETAKQKQAEARGKEGDAILITDVSVASLDPVFPKSAGWAAIRDMTLADGQSRVVIAADGGFSFTVCPPSE